MIEFVNTTKYKFEIIIGVFGNEEYNPLHDKIIKIAANKIKFLRDESLIIELKEKTIGIVGSKGSLDRPTYWQSKYIPEITKIYTERIKKLEDLLRNLKTDFKILLIHYPPTYLTLHGEKLQAYPSIGCRRLEPVLKKYPPDVVIHGHSHVGSKFAYLASIPIYNVAFPLRKSITSIELPTKGSLLSYF